MLLNWYSSSLLGLFFFFFSIVRNALMFNLVLTSLQIIISLLYILKDCFCARGTHFTFRYIVPDCLPESSQQYSLWLLLTSWRCSNSSYPCQHRTILINGVHLKVLILNGCMFSSNVAPHVRYRLSSLIWHLSREGGRKENKCIHFPSCEGIIFVSSYFVELGGSGS